MGKRSRKNRKPPEGVFDAAIESLSHDGRGIARLNGKTTFIENALPGEQVRFRYAFQRRRFDEGRAEEIVNPAEFRVLPPCKHADVCGGCSLQHLHPDEQIRRKQQTLAEQLKHFGGLVPERWLEPLTASVTGYRGKARVGIKHVIKHGRSFVGFREKRNNLLVDIDRCEVLLPAFGESFRDLGVLIDSLTAERCIPQVEMIAGDEEKAAVFRHLSPLPQQDLDDLLSFCQARDWHFYLQPGNDETVHRVWPEGGEERLHYSHRDDNVRLAFHPSDFIQVNSEINHRMVPLALNLLDVSPEHRVLDLFCGLGNFTLPLARRAAHVVGVEGSAKMVERGYENARLNGIENVEFHAWDLTQSTQGQSWAKQKFDRILIDPPRTGAIEVIEHVAKLSAQKIVYVSCNPATLARDAGALAQHGYRLSAAGVMDMFPHTTHVESIALFERKK